MRRWNSKKIAFIAILIATSIAFVVIGAQAMAISSLPSFKLSLAGLPVKITGYLFGPAIGFVIGFITDVMTFLFVPVFYNPIYSLALACSGMIPGLFSWFYFKKMNDKFTKKAEIKKLNIKKIQFNHELIVNFNDNLISPKALRIEQKIKEIDKKIKILRSDDVKENKLLNFNLFSSLLIIILIGVIVTLIFSQFLSVEILTSAFDNIKLLQNPIIFLIFIWAGLFTIIFFLIISRFTMKQETFIKIVPLIGFIVLTEFVNLPLVSWADQITVGITFLTSFLVSLITSPIKIWFNLIIISFATKIVTPLITSKEANAYS